MQEIKEKRNMNFWNQIPKPAIINPTLEKSKRIKGAMSIT